MSSAKLMKGHTWAKGKGKLAYPAIAEYKYDEIRLDVRLVEQAVLKGGYVEHWPLFRSFADKPLHNLDHYGRRFHAAMKEHHLHRLDMGVLVNSSYGDTYRFVRSSNGLPDDLDVRTLDFILFDLPQHGGLRFFERMQLSNEAAMVLRAYGLPVKRPKSVVVGSEADVIAEFGTAVDLGYEGLMVKSLDHTYEVGKRINGWLKVKPEEDADGIITEIIRATSIHGEPLDRAGSVRVVCEDGSEAKCGGISHELGRLMLAHPEQFVGQWCEFKYMMRDRQGGYRHPRFHRLREAKA